MSEKVLLGKTPQADAERLKTLLAGQGIDVLTLHNPSSCNSGCSVELEVWAHPEDVPAVQQLLAGQWHKAMAEMGYDPKLAEQVFDPGAESATCPACATVFAPTLGECPDCGLQFSVG
jgi:hypothetical protein